MDKRQVLTELFARVPYDLSNLKGWKNELNRNAKKNKELFKKLINKKDELLKNYDENILNFKVRNLPSKLKKYSLTWFPWFLRIIRTDLDISNAQIQKETGLLTNIKYDDNYVNKSALYCYLIIPYWSKRSGYGNLLIDEINEYELFPFLFHDQFCFTDGVGWYSFKTNHVYEYEEGTRTDMGPYKQYIKEQQDICFRNPPRFFSLMFNSYCKNYW